MKKLATTVLALLVAVGLTAAPHGQAEAKTLRFRPIVLAKKHILLAKAGKSKEARCEILEFSAQKTGKAALDPKLERWKKELGEPPLSAFDTFKVTGEKVLTMAPGVTGSAKVTSNLTLLFKGFVKENDKDRLQLEVTIDNPAGKRFYRQTSTQDSGASQILSAGKQADANVFFVVTCAAQ
jgi:hypothetical protein